MSRSYVVGIADNINDAQRVRAALVAAGLDHARLAVVTADETSSSAPSELGMRLFRVESGRGDEGMIVESGGTQVPDVTHAELEGLDHGYSAEDALVDAGIPGSLAEELAEQVNAGKAVFVFHVVAVADTTKVTQNFNSAGLHAVRAHES